MSSKEEIKLLWNSAAIMLGAALPLILLGKAVTFVLVVMGILLGLMATKGTSLRSSARYLITSTPLKLLGVLYLAFLLSAVFGIDQAYSMKYFGQMVAMGLSGIALYVVFREMPARPVHIALRSLSISTVFIIVLLLLDAYLQDPRLSQALHGDKALSVHRLNFMSSVLAVLLPFIWAWLLNKDREQEVLANWFAMPLALISFLAVFVAGGRAGWVGVVIAAFVFLVVAGRKHGLIIHKKHWALGIITLACAPLAYGLSRGWDVMFERIGIANEQLGIGSGRLDIWHFAIRHVMDNPFTGIGLNAFRKLPIPAEGIVSNAHPHNFVIQLALETGFIGLGAALVVVGYVLYTFWQYAKRNIYGLAGFCSMLAFCVTSLANTSIFHAWWLLFAVVPGVIALRVGWSK